MQLKEALDAAFTLEDAGVSREDIASGALLATLALTATEGISAIDASGILAKSGLRGEDALAAVDLIVARPSGTTEADTAAEVDVHVGSKHTIKGRVWVVRGFEARTAGEGKIYSLTVNFEASK